MTAGIRLRFSVNTLLLAAACLIAAGQPVRAERKIEVDPEPDRERSTASPGYWLDADRSTTPETGAGSDFVAADVESSRRTVYHGRVVLEDGRPAYEPIPLERVCEGVALFEGRTDLEGRFVISPGQRLLREVDASQETSSGPRRRPLGGANLWRCELRAVFPGYRSDSVHLGDSWTRRGGDVGTLVLHPLDGIAGTTISPTSAGALPRARRAYAAGIRAAARGWPSEAARRFTKATRTDPDFAAAWHRLGLALQEIGEPRAAREAYERSVAADPSFLLPYRSLTLLAVAERDWEAALVSSGTLLEQAAAAFADAAYLGAVAGLQLGRLEEAERRARRALELGWDEREPRAILLHGVILDRQGREAEAASRLRAYLEAAPEARDAESVRGWLEQRSPRTFGSSSARRERRHAPTTSEGDRSGRGTGSRRRR